MKTLIIALLSFAAISCAQEKKSDERKRLSSVTWDLKSHKLVWEVQKGSEVEGKFVANGSDRYEITPDDAIMAVSEEKRGFTAEEAASLHKLLDTLSLYCAESVVWWDQGQGRRIDTSKPGPDKKNKHEQEEKEEPGANRQKVDNQRPNAAPFSRSDLIALLNLVFTADTATQTTVTLASR